MKNSTNERVRVRTTVTSEHGELVKELDSMAKRLKISRPQLCEYLLLEAVSRVSFSHKSVTSRKVNSKQKGAR